MTGMCEGRKLIAKEMRELLGMKTFDVLWWWFYDCVFVIIHRIVHLKKDDFPVYKLHLNKPDLKISIFGSNLLSVCSSL